MTGAIDERGRFPPCTAFAMGPCSSVGRKEKSVSWLFSTKPPTVRPEPNTDSTVVVMETTFPRHPSRQGDLYLPPLGLHPHRATRRRSARAAVADPRGPRSNAPVPRDSSDRAFAPREPV